MLRSSSPLSCVLLFGLCAASTLAASPSVWDSDFATPTKYQGDGWHLEPLTIDLNEFDFEGKNAAGINFRLQLTESIKSWDAAVMSSRDHLKGSLGWKYEFDHLLYENWRDLLEYGEVSRSPPVWWLAMFLMPAYNNRTSKPTSLTPMRS